VIDTSSITFNDESEGSRKNIFNQENKIMQLLKAMVEVLGATFSIKERKLSNF
jgi:hypothetical protein